jgi:hypothetical protein
VLHDRLDAGLPYITSFANEFFVFTDCGLISLSVQMDNLYLPIVNWLTIDTDGQCFGGLPYAIAIMLTTLFANGLYKFTDGEFISTSVMMDNLYLPMVNWLTIGTDGTEGPRFGGLPYAFSLMLTTSFTNGLYKFTDGEFISPSVPMDNLYLSQSVFWWATLYHRNNAN